MSRGFGVMQQAILETLDVLVSTPCYQASRYVDSPYIGRHIFHTHDSACFRDIVYRTPRAYLAVTLDPTVYDIRQVKEHIVSQRFPRRRVPASFAASFSRAIHTLVQRHALFPCWIVPVDTEREEWRYRGYFLQFSQGQAYLLASRLHTQCRFFTRQQLC